MDCDLVERNILDQKNINFSITHAGIAKENIVTGQSDKPKWQDFYSKESVGGCGGSK